ncbi:hypothetical protein Hanom_Chr07g00590571 [Helianthus anomalus]
MYTLMNSKHVITGLSLAPINCLLNTSHILFNNMSHLALPEKCAFDQLLAGIVDSFSWKPGSAIFISSIEFSKYGIDVLLATPYNKFLYTSPGQSFFRFWWICLKQNLCSDSGNTLDNAGSSPCLIQCKLDMIKWHKHLNDKIPYLLPI